jgi:lipoprotein-anchoring transpeptidase ErfK/SrfK
MGFRLVTFALCSAVAIRAAHHTDARTLDVSVINSPQQPAISPGEKGPAVIRAQILLARAHFSCGEIDGEFGSNLEKTVSAFQAERQLPATGMVDDRTWQALNADTAPVMIAYTITPDDIKGPFTAIPKDIMEQGSLPALGYSSPIEELAEHFHVAPAVLEAWNPGLDFKQAQQQIRVPNTLVLPPGEAARVVVSKSESSVRAYDSMGKLLAFYVATIGSTHDPLPIGEWKIRGVSRNPVFHYDANLFWDAADKGAKAAIRPGPNNPVGLVWIDLSKEHYGIHGTPEPSQIGHRTSHGCIRLTNWDAVELAGMVKPGVPAVLQE